MNDKKKIAIWADVRGWAFDSIGRIIKKELSDVADLDIYYFHDEKYQKDLFKQLEDTKNYDCIHFLWRKQLLDFESEYFKEEVLANGYNYYEYVNAVIPKITTSIYDHRFLTEEEISRFANVFNKYSRKYYACSKKLYDIYSNIQSYKKPDAILIDTFEKENFYPENIERFDNISEDKPLVIGWAGNSKWQDTDGSGIDYKGLHAIIEPVLNELISEGYNIQKDFVDREVRFIPNNEMVHYYSGIDLYLIASYQEGTPRPALEALGCGVPVIATDVGVVPEIFGPLQQKYIIGDRTVISDEQVRKNLKECIIQICNDSSILKKLSSENLSRSSMFDSTNFKKPYMDFFFN